LSILERQKTIVKIPEAYRKAVCPPPKAIKIEITPRCNYSCAFCAINFRKERAVKDMDWMLFKDIVKQAKDLGVEEIGVFYIGESFINPAYLIDAIEYCKEIGIPYVFLTSNASLARPEIVEKCMKAGLDSLKWSCNAYDEVQFKELMGAAPALFWKAYENIRNAYRTREAKGYKTKLAASSVKYNNEQMAKMTEFAKQNIVPYVDEYYWLPLYTAGGQATEIDKEHGWQPIAGNTGTITDPAEPIPCWTIFTSAHVMADGKLTACCLDGVGKWVMGDLKTEAFMRAWNSPKFVELREKHLKGDIRGTLCAKCALVC
jgi:MoaA/NifB/PqqE/SkfB family radical SAM enzyme